MTKRELLGQMATYLAALAAQAYSSDPKTRRANARFLQWLIAADEKEYITAFQVYCNWDDKGKRMIHKRALIGDGDNKRKLLSPIPLWKSLYPRYASMVRERDTLSAEYMTVLSENDFKFLADMGLIFFSPLNNFKDAPTKTLLQRLLKDPEQLPLVTTGETVLVQGLLEYTDFAYLSSTDDQLMASISFINSIRILTFALEEAAERDEALSVVYSLSVAEGAPVPVMKAGWVGRLRNNAWVSVKKEGDMSGASGEKPSAQNLANLIRNNPDLKALIRREKAATVLSMWGVSIADLIRNLMSDETVKAAWDRTFTTLLLSDVDPVTAVEMLTDTTVRNEFEAAKKRRKQIKDNQDLGDKLEEAFKKLFERPEYAGLNVHREPIGQDYEMIPDSDLLNAAGQEVLFEVGAWLVELKATGKPYAAMTERQGEKAATNKEKYALVVLELDGTDVTEESIKMKARFVTDIGDRLEAKYQEVVSHQAQQETLQVPTHDLEVVVDVKGLRYHIHQHVWRQGKTLEDFLEIVAGRRDRR